MDDPIFGPWSDEEDLAPRPPFRAPRWRPRADLRDIPVHPKPLVRRRAEADASPPDVAAAYVGPVRSVAALAQPAPALSPVAEPSRLGPGPEQPVAAKPSLVQPVAAKPSLVQPAAARPSLGQPAAVTPTLTQPVAARSTLVRPAIVRLPPAEPVLHAPPGVDPIHLDAVETVEHDLEGVEREAAPASPALVKLRTLLVPACKALSQRLMVHRHLTTLDDRLDWNPPSVRFRVEPWRAPFDSPETHPSSAIEFELENGRRLAARVWMDVFSTVPDHRDCVTIESLTSTWIEKTLMGYVARVLAGD